MIGQEDTPAHPAPLTPYPGRLNLARVKPTIARSPARAGWCALLVLLCAAGGGCGGDDSTRIELTTQDAAGEPQIHYTRFERAAFQRMPGGGIRLALRTEQPSTIDPTQTITQILYVEELWNAIPGTTYVEPTQVNALVRYAILTPPTGVRYDGSAFLTYRKEKLSDGVKAAIESGKLLPRYRMGNASEPFGAARINGTIHAIEDPAMVVRIAQELENLFSRRERN
jgi:hypothetical protein